jgi:hypothetical protein
VPTAKTPWNRVKNRYECAKSSNDQEVSWKGDKMPGGVGNGDKAMVEALFYSDKKPSPILSFPGIQLIGCSVGDLVRDGGLQALCIEGDCPTVSDARLGQPDGFVG